MKGFGRRLCVVVALVAFLACVFGVQNGEVQAARKGAQNASAKQSTNGVQSANGMQGANGGQSVNVVQGANEAQSTKGVQSAKKEQDTIRIGYMDYKNFIHKNGEGLYEGYGVDYLNEISKYTGWKYKYVFGTWTDILEKLKNKEIDFICTAQVSKERKKIYDFSNYPVGYTQGILYTRKDNNELFFDDFMGLNGKKIACLKGSAMTKILWEYAKLNNFSFKQVDFDRDEEMERALARGDVDVIATEHLAYHDGLKLISNYGADAYYMISYKNSELMDDLNVALSVIRKNPDFESDLFNKYYSMSSAETDLMFTREENEFIERGETIRVGSLLDRHPLSSLDEETNEIKGINVDIINKISEISGLKLQIEPISVGAKPLDELQNNELDLVASVVTNEGSHEYDGVKTTDPFLKGNLVIAIKKGHAYNQAKRVRLGLSKSFDAIQDAIRRNYPNYDLVLFDNTEEMIEAVQKGKVDAITQNSYMMSYLLQNPRMNDLQIVATTFMEQWIGLAALSTVDPRLVSIIDKTIAVLDKNEINDIISAHTIAAPYHVTLDDTIYQYSEPICIILALVIALIVVGILMFVMRQRHITNLEFKNRQLAVAIDQANHANNAKGQFLSRMSHEIRTPINAIVGFTEVARQYITEHENQQHITEHEKMKEYLEKIDVSSKILLDIINDVLDMSAIENEKIKIAHSLFDIKELMFAISLMYYAQCKQKGVEFDMKLHGVEEQMLYGDSLRLKQILLNLVSNAYKFTDRGGKVEINVFQKRINDNEVSMEFVVADTGNGMSKDVIERLFSPFEQESAETAKKYGGSGLGLSIAKNLVDLMKGTIEVESEKGVGTTFKVNLLFTADRSCAVEEQAGVKDVVNLMEETESSPKYDFTGKRALLVEDNEINRQVAVDLLGMVGVEVDCAVNGVDAVKRFTESKEAMYDVILMDIQMPDMDGYEATREIRKSNHLQAKTIPIIAMTANAFTEDITAAYASGMNGHVAKPIDTPSFYKTLKEIM